MRICIDSSAFVRGLRTDDVHIITILEQIGPELFLVIPRLVANEVTRNLGVLQQVREFYKLFARYEYASIVDEPVPSLLVAKYTALGLPAKADAFIGAFAEWQQVHYLLSDNRHFLRQLQNPAFGVLDPSTFFTRWNDGVL
jgi:predicted nucleic acid-binding protein